MTSREVPLPMWTLPDGRRASASSGEDAGGRMRGGGTGVGASTGGLPSGVLGRMTAGTGSGV